MSFMCSGILDDSQKPKLTNNFFEIGGTSINAVATVAKINQQLPLSIEKFISAKTIGELVIPDYNHDGVKLVQVDKLEDIKVSHFK